jgi:hypothetical protein
LKIQSMNQEPARRERRSRASSSATSRSRPRKLNPAHLMQEVKLVPNGWISLVEHQQRGYAYIAP